MPSPHTSTHRARRWSLEWEAEAWHEWATAEPDRFRSCSTPHSICSSAVVGIALPFEIHLKRASPVGVVVSTEGPRRTALPSYPAKASSSASPFPSPVVSSSAWCAVLCTSRRWFSSVSAAISTNVARCCWRSRNRSGEGVYSRAATAVRTYPSHNHGASFSSHAGRVSDCRRVPSHTMPPPSLPPTPQLPPPLLLLLLLLLPSSPPPPPLSDSPSRRHCGAASTTSSSSRPTNASAGRCRMQAKAHSTETGRVNDSPLAPKNRQCHITPRSSCSAMSFGQYRSTENNPNIPCNPPYAAASLALYAGTLPRDRLSPRASPWGSVWRISRTRRSTKSQWSWSPRHGR